MSGVSNLGTSRLSKLISSWRGCSGGKLVKSRNPVDWLGVILLIRVGGGSVVVFISSENRSSCGFIDSFGGVSGVNVWDDDCFNLGVGVGDAFGVRFQRLLSATSGFPR